MRETKTASYLLRMTPAEKAKLERLAAAQGTTLATALRVGADRYLSDEERRVHATA